MGKQEINIQDGYLFQCLKAGSALRIDLTTGRTLEGKLKRFDRFALVLEHEGQEVLVYKHAVATMEQQAAG